MKKSAERDLAQKGTKQTRIFSRGKSVTPEQKKERRKKRHQELAKKQKLSQAAHAKRIAKQKEIQSLVKSDVRNKWIPSPVVKQHAKAKSKILKKDEDEVGQTAP
jgi:rRNA maturation protein Rpf1